MKKALFSLVAAAPRRLQAARRRSGLLAVALLALLVLGACQTEDVGYPCKIQTTGQGAQVNSQGLDCETRLCLLMGDVAEATPQCTKICGDDGDCPGADANICADGFQCISVLQTGALKCCKMCVCKRFIPAGGSTASSFCTNYTPNCPAL
jgi:hypothetical protein